MMSWSNKSISSNGAFQRKDAVFRNWVRKDGSTPFQPEKDRYHLYISYACPWASRCLALLELKGLTNSISLSVVDPVMDFTKPGEDEHKGWFFKSEESFPGNIPDFINHTTTVRELYEKVTPADVINHTFSVPILWDKKLNTIVSNESSEIIRMFNSEFNDICENPSVDLYPKELRNKIDEVNAWVYPAINNGVYKCGFARSQESYDEAIKALFEAMDKVEDILSKQKYIVSNDFTEADIRLFVTLVRFDEVYHGHFKCNVKRVADYHNIENYVRDIYQMEGIKETVNMPHIKHHYHRSHQLINLYGIVPKGPGVDYSKTHDRDRVY
eukprot:Pgem_evm1s2693